MGLFVATPVVATKWDSPSLVKGLKADFGNILRNLESIYKDVYASPGWNNDGNPNTYPARRARTAITKGDACYAPSASGIAKAQGNSYTTSRAIFLANSDLNSGQTTRNYHRRGYWASTRYNFTAGNIIWLSSATAGRLVGTIPTATVAHAVGIAEAGTQFDWHPFLIYQTL